MTSASATKKYKGCGRAGARVGFSLVELVVVVVLLAILAGAATARLASFGGRRVRASAQGAAELLSIAARRDALTTQRVAIDFDAQTGRLRLMTFATVDLATSAAAQWKEDSLAPHVDFGDTQLVRVMADSAELDPLLWRVEFPQGGRRPVLSMMLADRLQKEVWWVELGAGAATARTSAGATPPAWGSTVVDLDAMGKEDEPW